MRNQALDNDGRTPSGWLSRAVGVGFALTGLASIAELWVHELAVWDESGPGPAFAPGLLAAMLVVLGAIMAFGGAAATDSDGEDEEDRQHPASMVKFVVLLVGLIACFPYLGGVLSLSLFVALEMLWVERSSVLMAVLSGVGALALIWLIFIEILAVPLPAGLLALIG